MQSHHKFESKLQGRHTILNATDRKCTVIAVAPINIVCEYKCSLVQSPIAYITANIAVSQISLFGTEVIRTY
jgi:hypothetical protein